MRVPEHWAGEISDQLINSGKRTFSSLDKVGDLCVFDVGGNKLRIVASIHLLCFFSSIKFFHSLN
jgi:mRNA-degrading endonuclease HigB of HigAB toxin-antitoxin module